jgi:hypothetical protein
VLPCLQEGRQSLHEPANASSEQDELAVC